MVSLPHFNYRMTTLLSSIWQNLTRHGLVFLCLFVVLLWKCYKQRCEIRNLRNENLYFKDLINKVIMTKHQKIIINYNHGRIIYNGDMDHPVFNYGNETDDESDEAEYADFEEVDDDSTSILSPIYNKVETMSDEEIRRVFKHSSQFVRERLKAAVDAYYNGDGAQLALIEATFYDHGQLYHRNHHTDFIKVMQAWDILSADLDVALTANTMSQKMRKLPEGRYKGWGPEHEDEKEYCILIGKKLPESMPYKE